MDQPFIVVVPDAGGNAGVIERIEQQTDRYKLADNVWLIRSELLVKELAEELGVGEVAHGSAVVFRLNGAYWGRSDQNTWDWLSRGR